MNIPSEVFPVVTNEDCGRISNAASVPFEIPVNTCPVHKPTFYNLKFPSFREPSLIGHFSVDGERNFCADDHQKKYCIISPHISRLQMNLNIGYDNAVRKSFEKVERIDHLLNWILLNKSKLQMAHSAKEDVIKDKSLNVEFVCYRGLLTKILCTPYENREDWLICATKFKGTIYLVEYFTEKGKEARANQTPRENLMSYWGYKFEQYMTTDEEGGQPNIESPVNENEEFCAVVRTKLNNHSFIYGAEMDGVDCAFSRSHPGSTSLKQFIELKTSREITTERQDINFCRFKLIKWWAQSFLIGISKIICGFRDDDGVVRTLRTLYIREIPKMSESLWAPSSCMNFCDQFLCFVKSCVTKDNPYTVYKFYWSPGKPVTCTELKIPQEFQILPEWYINST